MAMRKPSDLPRAEGGRYVVMTAGPMAENIAAPAPWSTRNTIRLVMSAAIPHNNEPRPKSTRPRMKSRRKPYRSPSFPIKRIRPVMVSI